MLLYRSLLLIVILAGTALASHSQTQGESRIALLIGNATYKSSPLKNPVNDVRLMESSLNEAGFTVLKAENATRREMQRLVRDFGERLKQSGGVGLFYFAGHGVQVKGANYLVPVDADIRAEDEVAFDSVDAQSILEKMETAKNRINLLILDACRDNPFAKGSRSGSAGLATMSAPSGSLVAYSTAPGSVASDGAGNNGLYTQHLAAVMRVPDMPIEEVFKRVRASVRKDSANQQTPWENTALEGNFYFKKSLPVAVAALSPAAQLAAPIVSPSAPNMMAVELAYWDSIKSSNRAFELEAYIEQFPSGMFVGLAKARLREVVREKASMTAPQPAPVVAMAIPTPMSTVKPNVIVTAVTHAPVLQSDYFLLLSEGQKLGTLVLHDRIFNKKSELLSAVNEKTDQYVQLSTGDKVSSDGRVLSVRMGEYLVELKAGQSLWKMPLALGQQGKADVIVAGFDGRLTWQVKAGSAVGAQLVVYVEYDYSKRTTVSPNRSGTWAGEYWPQQWFAQASTFTQRAPSLANQGTAELVTANLIP
jgi:Caspase domain